MILDKLMINEEKTEVLLVGKRQQLRKVEIDAFTVGSSRVLPTTSVRNLGAWFDSELTITLTLIKSAVKSVFLPL